jgi:hypothetical protein
MMEVLDDGTYFMNEVQKMIGSAANNDNANRQRKFRESQKQLALCERYDSVTKNNESKSKRESKSKSKSKSIEKAKFVPPTLEEVEAYCRERNSSVDPHQFFEYFDTGNWKDAKGNAVKNWKQKLLTWEKYDTPRNSVGANGVKLANTESDLDDIF